ncbi:hypothetical protein CH380_15900 [Leptospira adleri]|uniref:Uncharacterized protein n=1 Tax=Leptospira adleri TaxID=2023186 RepID=A0A2M9YKV4_9LEPT|nr:hypothetical protein CH380_15900 [Leptospira adleri]PJZ59537.1 hypothetical protein CH376_23200 [Leptospira adleri]
MRYQQIAFPLRIPFKIRFNLLIRAESPAGVLEKNSSLQKLPARAPKPIFSVSHFRNSGDREFLSRYNLSLC